jgi:hypothetical protein
LTVHMSSLQASYVSKLDDPSGVLAELRATVRKEISPIATPDFIVLAKG